MAPALVETVTETKPDYDYTNSGTGAYKVAFNTGPKAFKKDNELQGTEKQPPAKYPNYLPVWNNETSQ